MKNFSFLLILTIFFIINLNVLNAQSFHYRKAPSFNLYTLNNELFTLEDFKDKSLVLFFWTTWCPYCRKEFLWFSQVYNELKTPDIEFLAINIGESREKIQRFLEKILGKASVEFKILIDKEHKVASEYLVLGIPWYVLIDKQGRIKFQESYLPKDYQEILKD